MSDQASLIQGFLDQGFDSMEWRAQLATPKDVLFYRLPDTSEQSIKAMRERLSSSAYGTVVISCPKGTQEKLRSEGLRDALFCEASEFYSLRSRLANKLYPLEGKKFIAITGTNGKTTTVDFIRQLLLSKKHKVITIGTLGVYLNEKKMDDFGLTSPDYIDLRKALSEHKDEFEVCALEASSHALEQGRLKGLRFDAIGWTSFSQDHLDYHKTMEEYFHAKLALKDYSDKSFRVSARAMELVRKLGENARLFGAKREGKSAFLKSAFNQINLDVALGCLEDIGVSFDLDDSNCLDELSPPPGRFNVIENREQTLVVDFAHTPDALENVAKELKRTYPQQKLICVFGCGGDRDGAKRSLMGKVAGDVCDHVYVTSDNPRFENRDKIIADILEGFSKENFVVEPDRSKAIGMAMQAYPKAVVLVAGKGHEPYIDELGEKRPYSDLEEIKKNMDPR